MNSVTLTPSNAPLLSIIIPVYNTEKYLPKCIEGILNQSYQNFELIIVDDCSPGNVAQIAAKYQKLDKRVKLIRNEKNRGSFMTRIRGTKESSGKYIGFIDADDWISPDFFRLMIEKAEKTDSDLVIGEHIKTDGRIFEYKPNIIVNSTDVDLYGDEIKDYVFKGNLSWDPFGYLWQRIVRRDLWLKCLPFFESIDRHLIICEDVMQSIVLYSNALHFTNCRGAYYYYYSSLTSIVRRKNTFAKLKKVISDTVTCFEYVFEYAGKWKPELKKYLDDFHDVADMHLEWYKHLAGESHLPPQQEKELNEIADKIYNETLKNYSFDDRAYYYRNTDGIKVSEVKTDSIRKAVINPAVKAVIFDAPDTLLTEPFYDQSDLLIILDSYAENLTKEELRQKELELTLKYTRARSFGKELYSLASWCGKRIVITSDSCQEKDFYVSLLESCGYKADSYEKLYASKPSCELFRTLISESGLKTEEILLISSDSQYAVPEAQKAGVKNFYLPRALDAAFNKVPGLYAGDALSKAFINPANPLHKDILTNSLGLRCMTALYAARFFDNPFALIRNYTDFNSNAEVFGYLALGMQKFAAEYFKKDVLHSCENLPFQFGFSILMQILYAESIEDIKVPVIMTYETKRIIKRIKNAAGDFCRDMTETFGDDIKLLPFTYEGASVILENFFRRPQKDDLELFKVFNITEHPAGNPEECVKTDLFTVFMRDYPDFNEEYFIREKLSRTDSKFRRILFMIGACPELLRQKILRKLKINK